MINQLPSIDGAAVAILYQAVEPPVIDRLRKDAKPRGYADAGADIAWTLSCAGAKVTTPVAEPKPYRDLDWVFPDDAAGIAAAQAAGATIFRANTVLFAGHPIDRALHDVGS